MPDCDYFRPRRYKGLSAAEYLTYLLAKLDGTLAMFTDLLDLFRDKAEFHTAIERERRDEVARLIRLQYVLGWDTASSVRTHYREADTEDMLRLDLDHVVPVNEMARLVIDAKTRDKRHSMFVRAWLAPIALISRESHQGLRNAPGTSDLMEGSPFARYAANGIRALACGKELAPNFTIQDHYLCLAGNELIGGILREYGIVP